MVDIHYIRQKEPKGLGHAVWCARNFIGDEPFAVLLGDDIVQAETPCLKQLMNLYDQTLSSVIGVKQVPESETHRYGVIDPLESMDAAIKCGTLSKNQNKEQLRPIWPSLADTSSHQKSLCS